MKKKGDLCDSITSNKGDVACKVESIIGVDERGQMVLPKELRERANIGAGDKLAIASWEKEGKVRCLTLIKVEDLVGMMKEHLGPIIREMQ